MMTLSCVSQMLGAKCKMMLNGCLEEISNQKQVLKFDVFYFKRLHISALCDNATTKLGRMATICIYFQEKSKILRVNSKSKE